MNNPSDDQKTYIRSLKDEDDNISYVLFGYESAPSTGTPHLQGFILFANARRSTAVRALLPGCHVTVCRGTIPQNITYCKKGGDWEEFGSVPAG